MILDYVSFILDSQICIEANSKKSKAFLKKIGAKRKLFNWNEWYIKYTSKNDLAYYFNLLRNEGFYFSYDQHGWGPSAIFMHLKELNLISGGFVEIYWTGPGKSHTRNIE